MARSDERHVSSSCCSRVQTAHVLSNIKRWQCMGRGEERFKEIGAPRSINAQCRRLLHLGTRIKQRSKTTHVPRSCPGLDNTALPNAGQEAALDSVQFLYCCFDTVDSMVLWLNLKHARLDTRLVQCWVRAFSLATQENNGWTLSLWHRTGTVLPSSLREASAGFREARLACLVLSGTVSR